ncbi:hypothetical protein FRC10_006160, partial [Ceratobasidium sp. 414]
MHSGGLAVASVVHGQAVTSLGSSTGALNQKSSRPPRLAVDNTGSQGLGVLQGTS